MIFNRWRTFEHDPFDRRGFHEVREKLRKGLFSVLGLQAFLPPNIEESSGTEIERDVGPFTTPAILVMQDCTIDVIYVNVETLVEPCKSARVANQAEQRLSTSQPPTTAWMRRSTTKLMQIDMTRKTVEEVQSRNGDAQFVYCNILRTELGVFDYPPATDVPPGYSVGPGFVKDVTHNWILN